MSDRLATRIKTYTAAAIMTAALSLFSSGSARAQAIRCEALVFAEERIACYNYRASIAPGPSCLFCAEAPPPRPHKKPRRKRK